MNIPKLRAPGAYPLPPELADVAQVDIKDVCAVVRMSKSWIYNEISAGRFPQPSFRDGNRCTRWSARSIRDYLIARTNQPQVEAAQRNLAKATKASNAARAKRAQTTNLESPLHDNRAVLALSQIGGAT